MNVCLRESESLPRVFWNLMRFQVSTLTHSARVTQKLCYSLIHNEPVSDRTWCFNAPMLNVKQFFNANSMNISAAVLSDFLRS